MPDFSLKVQSGEPRELWEASQRENVDGSGFTIEQRQGRPPPGTFGLITTGIVAVISTLAAVAKFAHFVHGWLARREKTVLELVDERTGAKIKLTRKMTEKEVLDAVSAFFTAAQNHPDDDPPSLPPP